MIVWVIAGLLGLATGLRIGWALVNKQSLVSTAMILALGSLGIVAALNWQPLTLLIDTALRWPNIAVALSQVALIGCAAGSCVMITTVASSRKPAVIRRIAIGQYVVAGAIAVATLVAFFRAEQMPEMAPEEYLRRNLAPGGSSSWLLPLLYVLLALTLVAWAGVRHSNRTRRGRALFVFSVGMVLMVLASAFFLLRAVGNTDVLGVGAAATLLGCAMLVVAGGSLLPSVEDWFGARRELRTIQPLLAELNTRHPDVGIGVRPRGPLLFRVAEQMSLISDSLYLEAIAAEGARRRTVDATAGQRDIEQSLNIADIADLDSPPVPADEQARGIAEWIFAGRNAARNGAAHQAFPGLNWLRQPATFSDREWILAIAEQFRELELGVRAGG
ncbi:MAG: rane protein [Mycobacterium sp.]|nr:rane protein [Mycobacterium sp.]